MYNILSRIINIYKSIKNTLLFQVAMLITGVFTFGAVGTWYFEYQKNENFQTPLDVLYFLVITMSTVGYGDKSPITPGGKLVILVVIASSIVVIALVSATAAAFFIESKIKEELGMNDFKFKDHFVIVGWNFKGAKIIDIIYKDPEFMHSKVVIVADVEKKPNDHHSVHFVKSTHPSHVKDLERASAQHARAIILLADYSIKQGSDSMTTINCMLARKVNPTTQLIVELLNPSTHEYFQIAGANRIIGLSEIGSILIAGSCLGHENVQKALNELERAEA